MKPPYDRTGLSAGIAHIGVGAFHRAHQAMYVDRLLREGAARDWAILGVGVLEQDRAMRDALAAQDHLYTLVEKHADGTWDPRTIGSIVDFVLAPEDPGAGDRLADPRIRIVSLTITEGGYEPDAPAPAHELVTEALRRRRERGIPPFTVMSCDNLEHNGERARAALARVAGGELGAWIEREVAFPNSMVDRITPATTDADRAELERRFGVEDRRPVICEPFSQWVLEDHFPLGRPPLEDVGVQLVEDVEPYERMKLRLLNAGHQALAHLGALLGHELVHDAAADPALRAFLRGYMDREATPTLAPVPGVDLDVYKDTLLERFANPQISDTIARLAFDSATRMTKFVLPVIRDQIATGGELRRASAIVAAWEIAEPQAYAQARPQLAGVAADERFAAAYTAARTALLERGARAAVEALA